MFVSVFLSCLAIGVQMTLEMLEKRFWSIATQVLKQIYQIIYCNYNLVLAVRLCMFIFVAAFMFC